MKHIEFLAPIDYMSGNLSGRQDLTYTNNDTRAYEIPVGQKVAANGYSPRIIGNYRAKSKRRYFMVRTRSTVNATTTYKRNLAISGGTYAIFYAIGRETTIYNACVQAWKADSNSKTLRKFMCDIIRAALASKLANIEIGSAQIDNPWRVSGTPNIQVAQTIIDKFAEYLSE